MAKRASSKKKAAKGRKTKRASFSGAMRALAGAGVPRHHVGHLNEDGTHHIDPDKVEALKKKLGKEQWGKVRFVALNAPFKRRSPVPPA
jgi:hypothetical protein